MRFNRHFGAEAFSALLVLEIVLLIFSVCSLLPLWARDKLWQRRIEIQQYYKPQSFQSRVIDTIDKESAFFNGPYRQGYMKMK